MTRQTLGILLLSIGALLVSGQVAPAQQMPDLGSNISQPQIMTSPDGRLLLSWTVREGRDYNLFVSTGDGDSFSTAVQVNTGPLSTIPIDEMRPAIALLDPRVESPSIWTDREFDIQTATSLDGGRSFGAPIRLNQDEGTALQEFPAIAFDEEGILPCRLAGSPNRRRGRGRTGRPLLRRDPGRSRQGEESDGEPGKLGVRLLPSPYPGRVQRQPHDHFQEHCGQGIVIHSGSCATPDGAFGEPGAGQPTRLADQPVSGGWSDRRGEMTLWFDGSTGKRTSAFIVFDGPRSGRSS